MTFQRFCLVLATFMILFVSFPAIGQEDEGEWPPRNDGFTMSVLFGTEAVGGGPGYVWWDLGKEDRNLRVQTVFADTDYRIYLLEYSEPGLIKEGERVDLTAFYQKRTGTHFFGIGPDREMEDGAYYQRENYLFSLAYRLPIVRWFGLTGEIGYDRVVIRESTLSDREDFDSNYSELDRPVEDVYPGFFETREARDEFNHYWSVGMWFDFTEGRENFPTRGFYLSGDVARIDGHNGADWNYWRYNAKLGAFHPLDEDRFNIIGLGARWDRLDGRYTPFYKLPSLGHTRFSTGYTIDGYAMRGIWENLYADENRFLAYGEYRHRTRAGWVPQSWREAELPFDFNVYNFIRNSATYAWLDAGQVWPDDENLDDLRYAYGIGGMLYFESGLAQQITVGFSEDLSLYTVFCFNWNF